MNNNLSLLSISRDITNTISRACVMIVFFVYFSEILAQTPVTGYISIIFIIATCFLDYFARKRCKNILLFLSMYIAMIILMFLLPVSSSEKIVLGIYLALTVFLAIKFWISEETSKMKCVVVFPTELIVIILPIYFHSLYRMSDRVTTYIFVLSLIFVALNFVDQFMEKLLTYTLSIPSGSIFPLNKVFATNLSSIMMVLLIAGLVIFAISDFTYGDGIILNLLMSLALLFGKLISGFGNLVTKFEMGGADYTEEETTTAPGNQLETDIGDSLTANPIIAEISRILSMVVLLAIVILVLYLIFKFISMYFRKNSSGNDVVEKVEKVISEKSKKTTRSFNLFKAKNNNDKVRRLYKKKILSYNKTFINIDDADTPKDLQDKIHNKSGDNLRDLTVIYEAARYGNNVISNSELAIAKKLTKK
ncbi:MAG: hypothetical protein IJC76_08570 [Lachnospiraceae bacterium]|nr:hypothetical protein [Lachnospiraceae bacterium]